MFKNNLGYIPKAVESLFITNSDIHKYNTRNRNKMRSAYGKYEFMYSNLYILHHLDVNVTLVYQNLKHTFWLIILHIMLSSQLSMVSYLPVRYLFSYHLFISHFNYIFV